MTRHPDGWEESNLHAALVFLTDAATRLSQAEEAAADTFEYTSARNFIDSAQREVRRLLDLTT